VSVTASRRVAHAVIRRVFESGAFADRALHAEAAGLTGRDRSLATQLAFGTVQRARTLDFVLAQLSSRPLAQVGPGVLAALRLGAYQLLCLDGISDYAAVNESVELAKADSRGAGGFVNAVLRRVSREGAGLLAALSDATPEGAAVRHSVPDWLAALWFTELGAAEARALLAAINRPAESALRVNGLRGGPVELPVGWHGDPELPEARVLEAPFDVFSSPLWAQGRVMPQSRASMLVARALAPQPGERVLDLCAAPGGKTTHLAALLHGTGEVVACEIHPGRAAALARTCARMGAEDLVRVLVADGRALPADLGDFDRVLVDPPCSGLGTLQSRPDLRWQERRGQISALAERQHALLASGAARVRPGGRLVYSLCTISATEGEGVLERFLAGHPGFSLAATRQLAPHRDGTDGFFIAVLQRPGS
jgi:16S rRNA (cytosine967-C5)-methyltransferase